MFSVIYDIHTASTDEWKIEKLNQGSLSPVSGLSDTERRKFRAQYTIIEENFYNLYEHVNGDITDVPYIETEHTEKAVSDAHFEHYRLVHNYLASVYSYIEHVRILVNRKTGPDVQFNSTSDFYSNKDEKLSHFSWKLTFLIGLRTACQHSDFPGVSFERYTMNKAENIAQTVLTFNANEFIESDDLDNMSNFMPNVNNNITEYPVKFIQRFHRNDFQRFANSMTQWFKTA